jgi:hypothetical protein
MSFSRKDKQIQDFYQKLWTYNIRIFLSKKFGISDKCIKGITVMNNSYFTTRFANVILNYYENYKESV